MVSSAILRRWIFSPCCRTNRMISSTAMPVPWLMLPPEDSVCKFYSIEKNLLHNLYSSVYRRRGGWKRPESAMDIEFVGSSDGWLALYNSRNHDLSLLNPTSDRLVKLPTAGSAVHHVIAKEKERFAFMNFGSGGGLAFCSPWDTKEWTVLKEERVYNSLVYSTKHNCLFCISDDKRFEVWDCGVDGVPRLVSDWVMDFDSTSISPVLKKLTYLVCAEQNGVLFLLVRHVRINGAGAGAWVDRGVYTEYSVPKANYFPSKTEYFEVYEIDLEQQRLVGVKDSSLQGLVMFVGTNEPLAIPGVKVPFLKPNSIYFTYDRRLRCECDDGRRKLGARDMGVFDYQKRVVSRVCPSTLIESNALCPLWFFPHMSSI